MRLDSVDSLMVQPGQRLSRGLWNRMVRWVERQLVPGGDAFWNQTPSGRFFYGVGGGRGGSGFVDHPWLITMEGGLKDGLELRFRRALVNGVEPRIGQVPIGQEDEKGQRPALKVKAQDFGSDGLCRVYAKVALQNPTFAVMGAQMVAQRSDAVAASWVAWKLVALLVKDGEGARVEQMCFFNQSLVVVEPRGNGRAGVLWTAT